MRLIDLTGKTFGRLTVLERAENSKYKRVQWRCLCSCGDTTIALSENLKSGNTQSCGCFHSERVKIYATKHKKCGSPEYYVWRNIINRCTNPKTNGFEYYGGKGISICKEWLEDFREFFNHVGARPSNAYTIDRIDSDRNYEPGNVRWATWEQQGNNKSNNHAITFKGKTMNMAQWAKSLNMQPQTLSNRINWRKWPIERALTQPVKH